jgi:hypothetical protein
MATKKPAAKKPAAKTTAGKATVKKVPAKAAAKKPATKPATKKKSAEFTPDPEVLAARAELERLREQVTDPQELEVMVAVAVGYHHSVGQPDVATKLKLRYEAGTPLTRHELRVDGVHPFVEAVPVIAEPTRQGPGSAVELWQEFAKYKAAEELSEETIMEADRDDLIAMLEANGIIERV